MAVVVINDAWGIKGEVVFEEYNHKTNQSRVVEKQLTRAHIVLIHDLIDSTDFGQFLSERVGDVELRGFFTLIQD